MPLKQKQFRTSEYNQMGLNIGADIHVQLIIFDQLFIKAKTIFKEINLFIFQYFSAQDEKTSSQWITPTVKQITMSSANFTTQPIKNFCPTQIFAVFIQSTCTYAIHIIDELDKTYKELSMGSGAPNMLRFTTQMKTFRLKFIVSDPCELPAIQFKLYQNRSKCTQCQSPIMHTWNPQICSCDCASRSRKCEEPQEWKPYPACTCGCKESLMKACQNGSYFDLRQCRCRKIQCKATTILF